MDDRRPSRDGASWRRRRQSLFDAIGLAAVVALTAANGPVIEPPLGADQTAVLSGEPQPWMASREVLYEVEGLARTAQVTMETPTGVAEDYVSLPLRDEAGEIGIRFRFVEGAYISVSGQNRVMGGIGTVTCRITVDGTVISEHTASGLYAMASCEANA